MAGTCPARKLHQRVYISLDWVRISVVSMHGWRVQQTTRVYEGMFSLGTRADHGACGWDPKSPSIASVKGAGGLSSRPKLFFLSGLGASYDMQPQHSAEGSQPFISVYFHSLVAAGFHR